MRPTDADTALIKAALQEALPAAGWGDVPIGAVVTDPSGVIIGRGANERERLGDPTAHAEIVAMRQAASALGTWRLDGCTLAVTLEPCAMCAGALLSSRISRLVYGAWDEKAGAVGSVYDLIRDARLPQRAEVVAGVLAEECAAPITAFFRTSGSATGEPARGEEAG